MKGHARWFAPLFILLLIVTGCSYTEQTSPDEMPEMIRVKMMMPDKVKANEEVALQIKLTQGEKPVDDADHVADDSSDDDHDDAEERARVVTLLSLFVSAAALGPGFALSGSC